MMASWVGESLFNVEVIISRRAGETPCWRICTEILELIDAAAPGGLYQVGDRM